MTPKQKKIRDLARHMYTQCSDDNLEIDDAPRFSRGDGGTWVSAWVWVYDEED